VGCGDWVLRHAIQTGALRARRSETGIFLVRVEDLHKWRATHPSRPRFGGRRPTWHDTGEALATLGKATPGEIADYRGDIHPGNVRKHLLILEARGRAVRHPDGEWSIVSSSAGAA